MQPTSHSPGRLWEGGVVFSGLNRPGPAGSLGSLRSGRSKGPALSLQPEPVAAQEAQEADLMAGKCTARGPAPGHSRAPHAMLWGLGPAVGCSGTLRPGVGGGCSSPLLRPFWHRGTPRACGVPGERGCVPGPWHRAVSPSGRRPQPPRPARSSAGNHPLDAFCESRPACPGPGHPEATRGGGAGGCQGGLGNQ